MKTKLIFFALLVAARINFAQEEIKFQVTEDDPKNINNFSCNIDFLHLDAGFNNFDGTSINLGVWGHLMYKSKLGADYSIRYGYLTLGKSLGSYGNLASNLNIQLGGNYILKQHVSSGNNIVYLKYEESYLHKSSRVTFINVNSSKWRYTSVRGGLYYKRNLYTIDNQEGEDLSGNYHLLGLYGGICFGSSAKLLVQTDKFGERGRGYHNRFMVDVLLTPVNNVPENAKALLPIGARVIWQSLPVVSGRKNRKQYSQRFTTEIEAGYRMLDGLYVGGTIAFSISKTLHSFSE
ncbi:MAG: hypothetical protein KatS3mg032_1950 [Cyclobacteriaceae bacterium]|nr:MAG: hypothetical protein KatS3mg032_1950 [Cyclobacteriaceae bacterium]